MLNYHHSQTLPMKQRQSLNMESSTSEPAAPSSDRVVNATMQKGFERIVIQTTAGLVLGGLAGIVLARSGSSGLRKGLAGFGAGIGAGAGWTRTSMNLEDLLGPSTPAATASQPDASN